MKLSVKEQRAIRAKKASIKAKHGHETRWMYQMEADVLRKNKEANRDRSMEELREIAAKIWKREAPTGKRMPSISAARGIFWAGMFCSYCSGYTVIKLARQQRNILVLLHELTHALGPSWHGKTFVQKYFPLLWKYAGYDKEFLTLIAAEKGYAL